MKQIKRSLCLLLIICLIFSSGCSFSSTEQETEYPDAPVTWTVPEEETTEKTLPECPVDLMEYMTTNMEVYAYIVIPGTSISYPVVQSRRDDNYYIRRNWKGKKEASGCIFSQMGNNTYFTDPITVLYGHNTDHGDMFSDLLKYKDENFFAENNLIYIYLPYGTLVYRIFSSHTFDDRHILNSYNFNNPEVLAEFQQTLLNPPVVEKTCLEGVELGPESQILTLSTCAEPVSGCKMRYLVNGVLIDYAYVD